MSLKMCIKTNVECLKAKVPLFAEKHFHFFQ